MKTMKPTEQLDLRPDEEALAVSLRAVLQQRAQTQQLAPAVRAQILAAVVPRRRQGWWWRPACTAAAAALLVTLSLPLWRHQFHPVTEFKCMVTTPDDTMRIEWKSSSHIVIQRSAGWKERRLVVVHRNGTESSGLFVARPVVSLWK